MQVLQVLQKDGYTLILEQIILLLNRLWETRNNSLHRGKSSSPVEDMKYIQQASLFHSLISMKNRPEYPSDDSTLPRSQPLPPTTSSGSDKDWILLMEKHCIPSGKAYIISIFHQSQFLTRLCFRKLPIFCHPSHKDACGRL